MAKLMDTRGNEIIGNNVKLDTTKTESVKSEVGTITNPQNIPTSVTDTTYMVFVPEDRRGYCIYHYCRKLFYIVKKGQQYCGATCRLKDKALQDWAKSHPNEIGKVEKKMTDLEELNLKIC